MVLSVSEVFQVVWTTFDNVLGSELAEWKNTFERPNGKICSFQVFMHFFFQTVKDYIFLLSQSGKTLVLEIHKRQKR